MNNAVFEKKYEKCKKYRDIKLVAAEARRNYLISGPHCHTTKFFSQNLLAIGMKRRRVLVNKPVCLGLPILEISKIILHKFMEKKQNHAAWIHTALYSA